MSTTILPSYNSSYAGTHHYGPAHHSSHSPSTVLGGQTQMYAYSKVPGDASPITSYPPPEVDQTNVRHTFASYNEEPVFKIASDSWTACVKVPIPTDIANLTLTSLLYVIKYASTHNQGNSTIQADTILTKKSIPVGVVAGNNDFGVFHPQFEYGPRTVDRSVGLCLSSSHGIKGTDGGPQWCHYIDQQHINPNVRVLDQSHLYLALYIHEYTTAQTIRSLAIDVSATWQGAEGEADRVLTEAELEAEEADGRAEEEARKAEEANMIAKEEADRQATEAAIEAEEADRRAEAALKAKEEADRKAKEESEKVKPRPWGMRPLGQK